MATHRVSASGTVNLGGDVRTTADLLPKTSGTIYALIRLNFADDADDGKFWDTNDNTWQVAGSVVTWPTATYSHGSFWTYLVPAAAMTGKEGAVIELAGLTDNETTPASETVLSGGYSSVHVNTIAEEVWNAPTASHAVAGSFGANATASAAVNVYESREDDG